MRWKIYTHHPHITAYVKAPSRIAAVSKFRADWPLARKAEVIAVVLDSRWGDMRADKRCECCPWPTGQNHIDGKWHYWPSHMADVIRSRGSRNGS